MSELTPREIVAELDKYIIGQNQAKRMVAIAVRNRWRRQRLAAELRNEVAPRNIIMMGPTGARLKLPVASPSCARLRSSRLRPPSTPKSAMWAATWNP